MLYLQPTLTEDTIGADNVRGHPTTSRISLLFPI